MNRRSVFLIVLCLGVLAFLAGPPPRPHATGGTVPMSAFDAGHHLQDLHHSGKQHRFGQRRASETVPPPVVLPSLLSVEAPDVSHTSSHANFRPLLTDQLSELTPRAPPVLAA
jgi:hypothetical protein